MMEFLKKQYRALFTFYRLRFSETLFNCGAAFVLILLIAVVYSLLLPEQTEKLIEYFIGYIEETGILDEGGEIAVGGLFLNNARAGLSAVLYGLLPFLFLAALPLGYNAFLLGAFGAYYYAHGLSIPAFIAGIVPHGIFELPALVAACAAGIYLCREINRKVLGREPQRPMGSLLADVARVYALVVVPLMAVAAVVETYVTPLLMQLFM